MEKFKLFVKKNYIACTIVASIVLIAVGSLIIIGIIKNNENKIDLDTENASLYQYFKDQKTEFSATLSKENDKVVQIKSKSYNLYDNSFIYDTNNNYAYAPKDATMVLYLQDNLTYKVPKYSEIYQKDNLNYLKVDGKSYVQDNYFIYDGEDLYFFINESEIKVNDTSYNLSKYSYVVANNEYVIIYDYTLDKVMYYEDISKVNVILSGCSLDLLNDVSVVSGKVKMLRNDVKNLPNYSKED